MVLISSGDSLCMRLPIKSLVLTRFLGVEVAADSRLIIVVLAPMQRAVSQRRGETSLNLKICLDGFSNNRYAALLIVGVAASNFFRFNYLAIWFGASPELCLVLVGYKLIS